MQSGDQVLLAGVIDEQVRILRLNANGTTDFPFGGNNDGFTQAIPFEVGSAGNLFNLEVSSIAIDANGKIVVAVTGTFPGFSDTEIAAARFNADGSRDNTFGGDGTIVALDVGRITSSGVFSNEKAFAVDFDPRDNRVVIVGSTDRTGSEQFVAVRINSDGNFDRGPDISFGGGSTSRATAVEVDKLGRSYIAGEVTTAGKVNVGVIRLTSAFVLQDTGYGDQGNGLVRVDFGGSADSVVGAGLDSQGRFTVGGGTNKNGNLDFAAMRLNADGTQDFGYGTVGLAIIDFSGGSKDEAKDAVFDASA